MPAPKLTEVFNENFQEVFLKHFVKMKLQLELYQITLSRAEKQKWKDGGKDPIYINSLLDELMKTKFILAYLHMVWNIVAKTLWISFALVMSREYSF